MRYMTLQCVSKFPWIGNLETHCFFIIQYVEVKFNFKIEPKNCLYVGSKDIIIVNKENTDSKYYSQNN